MIKKLQLITLGCSKNRVDSERLLRQIFLNGVEIVPENTNLAQSQPDVIVLNTCGFIKDAKEESIDAILNAVEAKKRGFTKKVFVFGCLSQRYATELASEVPEVDGYFGVLDTNWVLKAIGYDWDNSLNSSRFLTTPQHYAYLKISEGCDRTCSYCSIPLIRGVHKSVPQERLIEETQFLASIGVKELIVIAQDTTYYGVDLYKKRTLAPLLERLCQVEGIEWIRLLYSYPASFPLEVLKVIDNNPKMCKYLDIPLQHINDKVLTNMRRGVDSATIRGLVEKFRKEVPSIALRTTMIVGHPGENKAAFEELKQFVQEYKFERLGAFTFSNEEGTWGSKNLKDTIPEKIKDERYNQLMEIQSKVSYNFNLSRVGSRERVIIDSVRDNIYIGRSAFESPEVDGEILIEVENIPSNEESAKIIGKFANVSIIGADEYDLSAKFL